MDRITGAGHEQLTTEWTAKLKELGDLIFEPIEGIIKDSNLNRILIVPNGLLTQIPFHALSYTSNGEKIMIDQYHITYSPSLKVFLASKELEGKADFKTLVVSDVSNSLPFSKIEAKMILKTIKGTKVLEGDLANYSNFSKEVLNYNTIHLATHALFNPESAYESGLCLAIDKNIVSDEQHLFVDVAGKITKEINNAIYDFVPIPTLFNKLLIRPGSVIFLSACDSGNSVLDIRGISYESISAAFLANGACGVICSYWPVDGLSSCIFALLYYSILADRIDHVTAFSLAQRKLKSITCQEICDLLNQAEADDQLFTLNFLKSYFNKDLSISDAPFESAFYWASYGFWGCI